MLLLRKVSIYIWASTETDGSWWRLYCTSVSQKESRGVVCLLFFFFLSLPKNWTSFQFQDAAKKPVVTWSERQRQRPSSAFSRKHLYPVIRRLMWFHGDSVMNSPCDTVKCFIPVLWEIPAGTALCKHPWWFMQCHWIQGGILDDEVIWLCWKQRALMKVFVICVWVSAQHRLFGHRW